MGLRIAGMVTHSSRLAGFHTQMDMAYSLAKQTITDAYAQITARFVPHLHVDIQHAARASYDLPEHTFDTELITFLYRQCDNLTVGRPVNISLSSLLHTTSWSTVTKDGKAKASPEDAPWAHLNSRNSEAHKPPPQVPPSFVPFPMERMDPMA